MVVNYNSKPVFLIHHPTRGNTTVETMKIVGRQPLQSKLNIILTLPHHASDSVLNSPKNYATQITTKTISNSAVGKTTDIKKVIIQMANKDKTVLNASLNCGNEPNISKPVAGTNKLLKSSVDSEANTSIADCTSDSWLKISSVVSISPSEWEDQSSLNVSDTSGIYISDQQNMDINSESGININYKPNVNNQTSVNFTENSINDHYHLSGSDTLDKQEEKIKILKDLLKRKNEALDRLRYIRKKT